MATHTYSIATDFTSLPANTDPSTEVLHTRVENAALIQTAFNGVSRAGDSVIFDFASTLPAPEKTRLDSIVANHKGDTETGFLLAKIRPNESASPIQPIIGPDGWMTNGDYELLIEGLEP